MKTPSRFQMRCIIWVLILGIACIGAAARFRRQANSITQQNVASELTAAQRATESKLTDTFHSYWQSGNGKRLTRNELTELLNNGIEFENTNMDASNVFWTDPVSKHRVELKFDSTGSWTGFRVLRAQSAAQSYLERSGSADVHLFFEATSNLAIWATSWLIAILISITLMLRGSGSMKMMVETSLAIALGFAVVAWQSVSETKGVGILDSLGVPVSGLLVIGSLVMTSLRQWLLAPTLWEVAGAAIMI